MADIMVQLQKLANENTAKTFAYNTKEAATSRSWQERMSNTAHQREVKDLIKAGLNPVLSSGGSGAPAYGASSASGIADSAVNAMGQVSSSRTSASAMKYSARQSAAAARYAADRNFAAASIAAAAQKYAADRRSLDNFFSNLSANRRSKYSADTSYKSSKYASDKSYSASVVSSEAQKWISQNKLASNKYEMADKHFDQQLRDGSNWINRLWNEGKSLWSHVNVRGYADKALTQSSANKIANGLSPFALRGIKNQLSANGYSTGNWNVAVIVQAIVSGKRIDMSSLIRKGAASNSAYFTSAFHSTR